MYFMFGVTSDLTVYINRVFDCSIECFIDPPLVSLFMLVIYVQACKHNTYIHTE